MAGMEHVLARNLRLELFCGHRSFFLYIFLSCVLFYFSFRHLVFCRSTLFMIIPVGNLAISWAASQFMIHNDLAFFWCVGRRKVLTKARKKRKRKKD
mgnify:CR=1 FL=1